MASSNKTTHYQLNLWDGSDKPTRTDFANDNVLIDTALWMHVADIHMHLTAAEKARVGAPFEVQVLQGTNAAQRTVSFDFTPTLAICFAADEPPVKNLSGINYINCGIAAAGFGSTGGCALGASGVILNYTNDGLVRYNLNNSDNQYVIIAFR